MTKEECIDWLCRLRADLNNGVIFTPWNKEFTEALTNILEPETDNDLDTKLKLIEANVNGYTQGLKDASNTEQEPTCDTCEYNTAAFNPCNACENKSEYKPQEKIERMTEQTLKDIDRAFKALEERDELLDKIKTEIEELDGKYVIGDYATYGGRSPKYIQLMEVLRIIDKYKEKVNKTNLGG